MLHGSVTVESGDLVQMRDMQIAEYEKCSPSDQAPRIYKPAVLEDGIPPIFHSSIPKLTAIIPFHSISTLDMQPSALLIALFTLRERFSQRTSSQCGLIDATFYFSFHCPRQPCANARSTFPPCALIVFSCLTQRR